MDVREQYMKRFQVPRGEKKILSGKKCKIKEIYFSLTKAVSEKINELKGAKNWQEKEHIEGCSYYLHTLFFIIIYYRL